MQITRYKIIPKGIESAARFVSFSEPKPINQVWTKFLIQNYSQSPLKPSRNDFLIKKL